MCCPRRVLGMGGTSSPYDEVDDRCESVRLKNLDEATSDDETGEEERVGVLCRKPVAPDTDGSPVRMGDDCTNGDVAIIGRRDGED